ncbi:MAG TPA: condensation domain-containing protein, partial [Micromonospora sp.]
MADTDVWSMFHSIAFDVSVFEMWCAWLTGARVVVVPYSAIRDPEELRSLLVTHRVTMLSQTPTAFHQLVAVDLACPDRLDALRYVIFAGEALDVRKLAGWFARYGDERPRLTNVYGTTETTVHAGFHWVRATELDPPVRCIVGGPMPHLRFYVLDRYNNPVPIGAVGEIAIGGAGVSLGYHDRPALTAEKFIADPFVPPAATADSEPAPVDRLYRTGDLGRWLPDGRLDYLGRGDFQVKVRGYRIELGEIESVLREHPTVADVVVVARAGRAEDTELAGYVVPREGQHLSVAELRAHARRILPEYLIPASLTVLDELPRTANGKLDQRALPAPDFGAAAGHQEPRDDLESQLVEIWREVLGADRIGVYDNFFDLGGHSLLATRAMSRTRAALGADLGVRVLFDHPTVAGLAEALRGAPVDTAEPIPVLPRQAGPDGTVELPPSSAQRRLWLLHQLDPASAGAYVIGSAVRLTGPLDTDRLRAAFAEVVARHEPLRTRFADRSGDPVQVVVPDLAVPVELVDLTGTADPAVEAALRERLTAPFELTVAPLVRLSLLRLGADEHLLALAMHHAIGDQWSTQVIVRDLVTVYRADHAGQPVELPAPAVQYADVAAAQAERLAAGGYADDLTYWTGELAELPVLDLPTDRVRPAAQTYRGAQRTGTVPADVVDRLGAVAR